MPIQDLLRPDQLAALRRLRKRIANRTHMRQRRSDPTYYKRLCIGVDLPLEAGTCGRWVNRSSRAGRCYHCHQRRHWLLNRTAPYEIAVAGALTEDLERDVADGALEQHIEHDGALVPLLDAVDDMLAPADACLRW